MFKKRGLNNKAPIVTQSVSISNLADEVQQIQSQANQVKSQAHDISDQNNVAKENYFVKQRNQMQMDYKEDQQQKQYFERLERDKKLQDLFSSLENDDKTQNKVKRTYQRINNVKKQQPQIIHQTVQPAQKQKFTFKPSTITTPEQSQQSSMISQHKPPLRQQTKKQQEQQMRSIFQQIYEQNKKEQLESTQQKEIRMNETQPLGNHMKVTKKANQMIIDQDDDGFVEEMPKNQFVYQEVEQNDNMLKVVNDYEGNISPQRQQENFDDEDIGNNIFEEDFQDELIRKTLTRTNYLKLQEKSNLKQTKLSQKKEKLLNSILKTSWTQIQSRLSSDISIKMTKRNQLARQMQYLQERLEERSSELNKKRQILQDLKKEHHKLRKVIYFMCYFGDQLGLQSTSSLEEFFSDLTQNIITKIQQLSNKVNIQDFMEKQQTKQQLKQKYSKGRKKIKFTEEENFEGGREIVAEVQDEDDEDDDGEVFMEDDI